MEWPTSNQKQPRAPQRSRRRYILVATLAVVIGLAVATLSSWSNLGLPKPTGDYAVGRTSLVLVDPSRSEPATDAPQDFRNVPLVVWYPAQAGTGVPAAYVEDLDTLRDALVATGELTVLQVLALRWVRPHSRQGAAVAPSEASYPVLLLSPGNSTNVEFYAALAEDLASRGYVVIGMNHPYQVTATRLDDGTLARYRPDAAPAGGALAEVATRAKISERVADVKFVLDQLPALKEAGALAGGRLNLNQVGILGHSNGGITAVTACRQDTRLVACANLDGQLAGGPFGARALDQAPEQPFLFVTKETFLHPDIGERFEEAGTGAIRVVVPAAHHDDFADGPLLTPSLALLPRSARQVVGATRGLVAAFFDHTLRGRPVTVLGDIDSGTDVFVNVYPLGQKPPIPLAVR
jgi:dienelactone hydrolase